IYRGNQSVQIVEAALDYRNGKRILYTVASEDLPDWVGGMASFDRSHIVKHDYLVPGISGRIREIEVDCNTAKELLDRLPQAQIDIFQLDAEGADGRILSFFPFHNVRPAIVHFESKNLTRVEQEAALDRLRRFGYKVARSGEEDMLGVQSC